MKIVFSPMMNISLCLLFVISCSFPYDPPQNAQSGDYSRLLTVGDYLYAINDDELTTFDVKNPDDPVKLDMLLLNFKIENITHSEGILFIGSQNSFHIFEIKENGIPYKATETNYYNFMGITACDPVIIQNNFAYISFTDNGSIPSTCEKFQSNKLSIYSIKNLTQPELISSIKLDQPMGLAIDGQYLFVCLYKAGISIIDVSNPKEPFIHSTIDGFECTNVVAKNGDLLVVGPDELRQYDYSNIEDIQYLSSIKIE